MPEEQSTPPFISGFGLGLLAGVAGFVLFGTKKGEVLRRDLQKAFAAAYEKELANGEVAATAVSLREFLSTALEKVKAEVLLDEAESNAHASARKTGKSKSKPRTKTTDTKTKFKNL